MYTHFQENDMTESAPLPESTNPSALAQQYMLAGLAENILLEAGIDTTYDTSSPVEIVRKFGLGAQLGLPEEDKL
jgi:hypothetical protein